MNPLPARKPCTKGWETSGCESKWIRGAVDGVYLVSPMGLESSMNKKTPV